ncbi:hypothetical protein AMAG_15505 [Allomyces macrogynus ATCC 38327]|uniref:EGF-like domain-containing protein n=1 Tax=Allomyces macrogynus (strain ATCC 38327) TaxID=578462 RepID=A0A0L0T8X4_ALLM3|nr:hypothetical protein AMAG_15505 [Allomyces macrogynus ATCC 38327]|eukprot:KNE71263.1 hypothetical protein AMAG_15505 [Allomyces macrogynus ATCC 38327]
MVMANTSFKNTFCGWSGMIAQLSGSASLEATDAVLDGYKCLEACVHAYGAGGNATLTRTNVTNYVLAEGELGVVPQNAGSLQLTNVLATGHVANCHSGSAPGRLPTFNNSTFTGNMGGVVGSAAVTGRRRVAARIVNQLRDHHGQLTGNSGSLAARSCSDGFLTTAHGPLTSRRMSGPCISLDTDAPMGSAYPVCVSLVCPQGCTHGTCTAAGQCTCDPGHEGVACQFPADLSDAIE